MNKDEVLKLYADALEDCAKAVCKQSTGETDGPEDCDCLWCHLDNIVNEDESRLKILKTSGGEYCSCRVAFGVGNPYVELNTETGMMTIWIEGIGKLTQDIPGRIVKMIDEWCRSYIGE